MENTRSHKDERVDWKLSFKRADGGTEERNYFCRGAGEAGDAAERAAQQFGWTVTGVSRPNQ